MQAGNYWDHGQTHVSGTLDASAPGGGDGGFIETSAARVQVTDSARITTRAASGNTGLWLIDPQDYTIASTGGDITGAVLSANLADNNVEIQSVQGGTLGNGDIFVNDTITWGANTLTLTAERNIAINATLNATGTAGLALKYAQADASGDYSVGDVMDPTNTGRVNLAATGSFSTQRGADAVIDYTIITTLGAEGSITGTDLQGMNGNLAGNYVLGADIDAAATSGWNGGLGFARVGLTFTGRFDGLGHTVSGLTINRPLANDIGLFGRLGAGASVRNIGLNGGSVTGNTWVGSLVGRSNGGLISNVWSSARVHGTSSRLGGLIGWMDGGILNAAYATGDVTGVSRVGGLIGFAVGEVNNIYNTYATGNVTGTGASFSMVGGLIGALGLDSNLSNSYATGTVAGSELVGGLIGEARAGSTVSGSYATGSVNGTSTSFGSIGGLIGLNNGGTVSESYAIGNVDGYIRVGGLIGFHINDANLTQSYATGNVAGTTSVGGLAGLNLGDAHITNTYAAGTVSGETHVGGLVGENRVVEVDADTTLTPTVNHSFFLDSRPDNGLGTAVTMAELQDPYTFIDVGWDFASIWGADPAKLFNNGYPIFRALSLPEDYASAYLRINLEALSRVYGDDNPDISGLWAWTRSTAWAVWMR